MQYAPSSPSDRERVLALERLQLLDSSPEEVFDALTRMAAELLNFPIALVSLVDETRQWFKSRAGLDVLETPREIAFCAHAIQQSDPLIVQDALLDQRFKNNPLVVDGPHIRAYAGVPLFSLDGFALGTFCAIDVQPRVFSERELRLLRDLAGIIQREIHARESAINARAAADRAMQELEARKLQYRAIFEGAATGIALVTQDGHWQMINRRLCEILGRSQDELLRMSFRDVTHPEDLEVDQALRDQILGGQREKGAREKRYIRPDGKVVWANVEATISRNTVGEPNGLILVVEDITARREAESALEDLRQKLEQRVEERTSELAMVNRQQHVMLDNDLVGIVKLRGRKALWHNRAFTHIFGGEDGEAVGRSAREAYTSDEIFEKVGIEAYEILAAGGAYRTQIPMRHKSGASLWIDLSGAMLSNETKESIWMLLDLTQMKAHHDEIANLAFHDPLTGLANRTLLNDRLEQVIAQSDRLKCHAALCFVDLDAFKAINDTLGHEAGDEVLKAVAERLTRSVRSVDTVARLGGDEFVVLLAQLNSCDEAGPILARATEELAQPIPLKQGGSTQVLASVGVAFYPNQKRDAAGLMAEADRAMYAAKRERKFGRVEQGVRNHKNDS